MVANRMEGVPVFTPEAKKRLKHYMDSHTNITVANEDTFVMKNMSGLPMPESHIWMFLLAIYANAVEKQDFDKTNELSRIFH